MSIDAYEGKKYRSKIDPTDDNWTVGGEIANPGTGIMELQLGRDRRFNVEGPRDTLRLVATVEFPDKYEEQPA